jgi:hypothetical protein
MHGVGCEACGAVFHTNCVQVDGACNECGKEICGPSTANEIAEGLKAEGRQAFKDLDTEALKRLYKDSRTLHSLGVLWSLGGILSLVFSLVSFSESPALAIVGVLLGALLLMSAAGMFRRASAVDRNLGFLACASIILFRLGLIFVATLTTGGQGTGSAIGGSVIPFIIAGGGWVALDRSERLFGPERLLHPDLKREYKHRKKNRIT